MDEKHALAEAQSAESVQAQTVAAEAIERARKSQLDAARSETTSMLSDAIRDAFGKEKSTGRFVDLSRIPMLCKNVEGIHVLLQEIKDSLKEDYVKKEELKPVIEKVDGLTSDQKWVIRTILAVLITAVMGLVIIK